MLDLCLVTNSLFSENVCLFTLWVEQGINIGLHCPGFKTIDN